MTCLDCGHYEVCYFRQISFVNANNCNHKEERLKGFYCPHCGNFKNRSQVKLINREDIHYECRHCEHRAIETAEVLEELVKIKGAEMVEEEEENPLPTLNEALDKALKNLLSRFK